MRHQAGANVTVVGCSTNATRGRRAGRGSLRTAALAAASALALTTRDARAQELSAEASSRAREHAAHTLGIEARLTPGVRLALPESGRTLLRHKVLDQERALGVDVDLDTGEIVDGDALLHEELAAGRARRGKLSRALRYHLEQSGAESVPVGIWIKGEAASAGPRRPSVSRRSRPRTDAEIAAILAAASGRRERELSGARQRTIAALRALGAAPAGDLRGPLLRARLTRAQLAALEAADDVVEVGLDHADGAHGLDVVSDTLDYRPDVHETLGLRGAGETIGDIEWTSGGLRIADHSCLDQIDQAASGSIHEHATNVAGVLICNDPLERGVAPDANLVFRAAESSAAFPEVARQAIDAGARIINVTAFAGAVTDRSPSDFDKAIDELQWTYLVTPVVLAGNRGGPGCGSGTDGFIVHPGLAYNAITVGGFDDRNTAVRSDDLIGSCSSWGDPASAHSDREKPEVAAPGMNIFTTDTNGGFINKNGTSFATPAVSGIASLMMNANHDLRFWPEAVKAGIMATARYNVEGASRLSERDGVGGVSARDAVDLVRPDGPSHSDWAATEVTCASFPFTYRFQLPRASRRTRFVIVWPQDPNYVNYAAQPNADLELEVKGPFGSVVGSSTSFDNTYEIAEFNAPFAGQYTATIKARRCDSSPGALAIAWFQEP